MSVQTVTDMRSFEGALDEKWCHMFGATKAKALCGCDIPQRASHRGSVDTDVCDGCGRRNCPECMALAGIRVRR